MTNTIAHPSLSRCLLAGLFTGMITAFIVLIFNVIYRRHTEFYEYSVVMPVSIFMGCPILHILTGGVYHLFIDNLRRGRLFFTLTFIVLSLVVAVVTAYTGNDAPEPEISAVRGLFVGLELIIGLMGAFFIPYFAGHSRIFLRDEKV